MKKAIVAENDVEAIKRVIDEYDDATGPNADFHSIVLHGTVDMGESALKTYSFSIKTKQQVNSDVDYL